MEIVVLVVLLGGMGFAWWWLSRRRREILGDSESKPGDREPDPPEMFTRDALVNRPRSFDPGRWDDSPDAGPSAPLPDAPPRGPLPSPEPEDGDLPTYFDREYLERKAKRQGDQPTDPAE